MRSCFAFVTRGLRVPDDLPEEWRELLMGLLTRDPSRRWMWPEVKRWLGGERGIPNDYSDYNAGAAWQGQSFCISTGAHGPHRKALLWRPRSPRGMKHMICW